METFQISGNIIDIEAEKIFKGTVVVGNGIITEIKEQSVNEETYILPGFVDAHVHIESSMLMPSEFARLAVVHGTVATVSDPHEIANVLGIKGIDYMIENGKQVPFKFYFGAPSCVPATEFETAGAVVSLEDIETLFQLKEVKYLAEMMNWPGVLLNDPVVHNKINLARKYGKLIDGHAPGLKGEQAQKYISAGISTDHECFTAAEALGKLNLGMRILVREGSAAKNFEALAHLLHDHAHQMMFCSDDKHPDSLVEGHINVIVKRALEKGIDLFKVLKAACTHPVQHYGLEVGTLRKSDPADFIVVDNLKDFNILKTFINGTLVAQEGKSLIKKTYGKIINQFHAKSILPEQLKLKAATAETLAIKALDGQLITEELKVKLPLVNGYLLPDVASDLLKIVVINRYQNKPPAIAFIQGFGLQEGALASSVAHDSHNIIAVGTDDVSISRAINELILHQGGISCVAMDSVECLPLPIAGLMSDQDGYEVAHRYTELDKLAKKMGSPLSAPFMTLSFMALLVIPSLKLSDKGLFNGTTFKFVNE